jgi:hypothetical protein
VFAIPVQTSYLESSSGLQLLPSQLDIEMSRSGHAADDRLFLKGHRLSAAVKLALSGAGHDELRAALGASVSLPHLISH